MLNTDLLKVIARSRQSSVSFREGGGKKSEMVDRDVLLRKTRNKLRDSPVNFEGRPAQCSAFFISWTRCPRCLGFGKSFIFQAFVIAVEMEREGLQIALV